MSFFDFTVKNNEEVILDVCKTPIQNKLFRDTIDKFHSYVKYKDSPTRNIRYLIYEARTGNHIGSIGLSSATLAVSCRDNFIGWSNDAKMKNLNKVANNSRFCLIGKNVTIENAGSQTLKRLRIDGALEWKRKYGDELILIETFILPTRDSEYNGQNTRNGSVYKADNWIEAGMTTGASIQKSPLLLWKKEKGERGRLARENKEECLKQYAGYLGNHNDSGYKVTKTEKKIVFVRPLIKRWKKELVSI